MKKRFKVIFPTGYRGTNIINDNIDVNIVLESGEVFFGVLGTIENIISFFKRGDLYYWSIDLLIVNDLNKDTIRAAIQATIDDENLTHIFSSIGTIATNFEDHTFDELEDMNDIAEYIKKS